MRWELHLHGFEADAQMLELVVVLLQLLFSGQGVSGLPQLEAICIRGWGGRRWLVQVSNPTLQEDDALSSTFSALNEQGVDVLRWR